MKLLIKFPTRSRPIKCLSVIQMYIEYAVEDVHFLVTLDEDDESITPSFLEKLSLIPNCTYVIGQSTGKINACNRDMKFACFFDILLLASDDMIPIVKGYDQIIREKMIQLYPDTDGVLWFNDGYRGNALNTLCILGRKYYDRFGYIYHPDYKSFYCDNEFTEVANSLGKQTYFSDVIIRHEHPFNLKQEMDELYITNETHMEHDKCVWIVRRHHKYPFKSPSFRVVKNGSQTSIHF
jgi:hypothetical protein